MSLLNATVLALKNGQGKLRKFGVHHVGVFGSVARGEHRDGNLDVVIEFAPEARVGLFSLSEACETVALLAGCEVNILPCYRLDAQRHADILRDIVYAF